jgi:hypothetical protein
LYCTLYPYLQPFSNLFSGLFNPIHVKVQGFSFFPLPSDV